MKCSRHEKRSALQDASLARTASASSAKVSSINRNSKAREQISSAACSTTLLKKLLKNLHATRGDADARSNEDSAQHDLRTTHGASEPTRPRKTAGRSSKDPEPASPAPGCSADVYCTAQLIPHVPQAGFVNEPRFTKTNASTEQCQYRGLNAAVDAQNTNRLERPARLTNVLVSQPKLC